MTAAPGPQQPDEVRRGSFDRVELEDGTMTNRWAAESAGLLPAAPSAQPDEVCTCPMNGPMDGGCEVHNPYTPAQPVRDTGEGRR